MDRTLTLSIILPTAGEREKTLEAALDSAHSQMDKKDELLMRYDSDAPWGHKTRNELIPVAWGDFLLFMDDDDAYVPGALDVVRDAVARAPERMHVFRMRYPTGHVLWIDPQVRVGNVSTQMVAVPRRGILDEKGELRCRWGDRYEGDFDFIYACQSVLGEPVWHPEVIALIRPHDRASVH